GVRLDGADRAASRTAASRASFSGQALARGTTSRRPSRNKTELRLERVKQGVGGSFTPNPPLTPLRPFLPPVTPTIGVDHRLLARLARLRVAVLHADHAVETLLAQPTEDMAVVDLARRRFLAARVVAGLDVGDLVPG